MSDVKDNGGLTLPYPTIFLFYDGEEPEYYTALTGENLNRPLKQLMANIKKLQSAIASGGMDDALLGILNSKMSIAGGNFIGPVTLPSWSDAGGDIPDNALINKGDIVQLINDTSGNNKARALEKSYLVVDYDYATLAKNPHIDVSHADETNQTICLCKGETTKALNLVAHLKFSGAKSDAETLIKFHNLSKAGSAPMTIEIGSTATFQEKDNYKSYPVTFPQFSLPPKITLQPNEYATLRCILNSTFVAIEVSFGTF